MPKYLILKHYRAARSAPPVPPDGRVGARGRGGHMAFQNHVSELLEGNGEYVDRAGTPRRRAPGWLMAARTRPPSPPTARIPRPADRSLAGG